MFRRLRSVLFLVASAAACSGERPAPPPRAASPAPTVTTPAAPPSPSLPAAGPFSVHEWGLFGVTVSGARALAAGVSRPPPALSGTILGGGGLGAPIEGRSSGFGPGIGKPVLYVHLDPGIDETRFSLSLTFPDGTTLREHWPPAAATATSLRFADVRATRGPCVGPSAAPTAHSSACRDVSDHFCEAAEVPRYVTDDAACLEVGAARVPLLFYRAEPSAAPALPLTLTREGDRLVLTGHVAAVEGPVLALVRRGSRVVIRRLGDESAGALDDAPGEELDVAATRALLVRTAVARGLTEPEAQAFVDAWAPAYFDRCTREGPEAHGHVPLALAEAHRSLLYFAPAALVDAAVPLATDPPPRELRRVFLVRVVDETSIVRPEGIDGLRLTNVPPSTGPGLPELPGSTSRGTLSAAVRVAGPVSVGAGIPADAVRRVVLRNINQLRACYERALVAHPNVQGNIHLDFRIGETGQVGSSSVQSSTLGIPELEQCFAAAPRRWTFPIPEPVGEVPVSIAFALSVPPAP